mgnify:CR=1 FL=1
MHNKHQHANSKSLSANKIKDIVTACRYFASIR